MQFRGVELTRTKTIVASAAVATTLLAGGGLVVASQAADRTSTDTSAQRPLQNNARGTTPKNTSSPETTVATKAEPEVTTTAVASVAASSAQQSVTAPRTTTTATPTVTTTAPMATTTPTPAAQASFVTQITRAGQVAPGTLISYSAAKGEKAYYGGDLVFNKPSVTISRSTHLDTTITVSIPDGQLSRAPSTPWDEPFRAIAAAYTATPPDGTSWSTFAYMSSNVPNGTYTVHLWATRAGQQADAWHYHGFLTVNIVD